MSKPRRNPVNKGTAIVGVIAALAGAFAGPELSAAVQVFLNLLSQ